MAVERGVRVESVLERYGLLSAAKGGGDGDAEGGGDRGWLGRVLTGGGSSVALAFVCNKALFPLRAPITVGLTPMVARVLAPAAARSAPHRRPE